MSSLPQTHFLTPEEYLAIERKAEFKSEYYAGEMFLLAGAREAHSLIVANVVGELRSQLKGRSCKVYPTDMRVKVSAAGLYTYPDVAVVCGEAQFEDDVKDTLLNPTVIIEVLSDSTEAYDRGRKFEHYRALPSLAEYLLVSQHKPQIERFTRQADGKWLFSPIAGPEESLAIDSIQCTLSVAEAYDKVEF